MKIEITRSTVSKFKLSYTAGDVVEIDDKLAEELIDAGYAKAVKQAQPVHDYSKMKKAELDMMLTGKGHDTTDMSKADMVEYLTR